MSTTHTPAPWELDYDKGSTQDILSRKHGGICTVRRAGRHDNATFAANARLIAAAPDMLAALEHADRELYELLASRKLDSTDAPFHAVRMVRDQVRAAIAKAKGTT